MYSTYSQFCVQILTEIKKKIYLEERRQISNKGKYIWKENVFTRNLKQNI